MLEVRGLRKSYGERIALAGVDLDVAAGEVLALLGPNGAGKTTLVSIVAGLRTADAGSVRINGIDALSRPHEARRFVGIAPQETGTYPTLTCRQNLRFFGQLAGLRGSELRRTIERTAEALGLSELLGRRAIELSGGERRRLHTALALVHRPALALLDEPTTGADVQTRANLLRLVNELAADGSAVVYSTHYLGEIEQLGASVTIIDRGRVVARGDVPQLVDAHAEGLIELAFDGPAPRLATSPGTRVEVDGSVLRVHTAAPRPETTSILRALGDKTRHLRSLQVVEPSLETVFLRVTGHDGHADLTGQSDVA